MAFLSFQWCLVFLFDILHFKCAHRWSGVSISTWKTAQKCIELVHENARAGYGLLAPLWLSSPWCYWYHHIYCWGVTWRLTSTTLLRVGGGGVAILLGASCYSTWLKHWPFWPHGLWGFSLTLMVKRSTVCVCSQVLFLSFIIAMRWVLVEQRLHGLQLTQIILLVQWVMLAGAVDTETCKCWSLHCWKWKSTDLLC